MQPENTPESKTTAQPASDGADAAASGADSGGFVEVWGIDRYIDSVVTFFEEHTLDLFGTAVIFVVALVLDIAQRWIARSIRRHAEKTGREFRAVIASAVTGPLGLAIWVIAVTVSIQLFMEQNHDETPAFFGYVADIRLLMIIALAAWFVARCLRRGEDVVVRRTQASGSDLDITALQALMGLGVVVVWVIAVLVGMQSMGFNLAALLTIGGVGAAAIGFAAQDCVANFFGGMMVLFNSPFKVGDWIQSPDRNMEGTVERIGLYATVVRSFDKRPIYVPNSIFLKAITVNPSRMTNRRIKMNVSLRYQDLEQVQAVTDGIKEMLQNHPEIDTGQTMLVNFTTYGDSSLDLMVYTFTKTTVWAKFEDIRSDVLLRIGAIVKENGADFAFPTRTIEFAGEPPSDLQPSAVS